MNNDQVPCFDSVKGVVFKYTDYKEYLNGLLDGENERFGKMTYQYLADLSGLESRTKMKKILKGNMPIPKKALEQLGASVGLDSLEISFLNMLRMFSDTSDPEMALSLYSKIIQMKKKHRPLEKTHELEEKQLRLLEEWYYIPVLNYFTLKNSKDDAFEIVRAFKGQLTADEVIKAIRLLVEMKLLKYNEDGIMEKVYDAMTLLDGIPRPLVKKYHSVMIQKAHDAVYGMPQEKRYLMSNTMTINKSIIPQLKEVISKFMLKTNEDFSLKGGNSLCQLNMQFFNIASTSDEEQ